MCSPLKIKSISQHLNILISAHQFSSVQSLSRVRLFATHELQHARPPCPSPTPGVHPNPCPLSWWCHPTISSSVIPFSSCLQSFPGSGSFQMSQLFASGGQSIGVSASTSALPMNNQDILYWCFSYRLTSLWIIGSSFIHLIRTDLNVLF